MNVGPMMRRGAGVIAVALLVAVVALTATRSGLALSLDPRGTGCRGFWGETVEATSWSRDGRFLAVAATGSGGGSTTRVFEWPGMRLVTAAAADPDYVAVDDDGAIYWMTWDPFSNLDSTSLWRQAPGGQPESLGLLDGGAYVSLSWAGGSLAAIQAQPNSDSTRLVRLSVVDPAAEPVALTDWTEQAGDQWIDRTGDWIVWDEPNVRGDDPEQVVARSSGRESRVTLPGYGGRVPTLTPDRGGVVYQRSETSRLTVVDLATGTLRGELDDHEFFGGEVSSQGILAAPTAHGPWQTNELCVLDVAPRLAALASGAAALPLPPSLLAPNEAGRDAFLAGLRQGGSLDLGTLLPGEWTMGYAFRAYDDNTTAANVLGQPFDLEAAIAGFGDDGGTVFVLSDDRGGVVGWFAISATELRGPFPRPDFLHEDAHFRVVSGDAPRVLPD